MRIFFEDLKKLLEGLPQKILNRFLIFLNDFFGKLFIDFFSNLFKVALQGYTYLLLEVSPSTPLENLPCKILLENPLGIPLKYFLRINSKVPLGILFSEFLLEFSQGLFRNSSSVSSKKKKKSKSFPRKHSVYFLRNFCLGSLINLSMDSIGKSFTHFYRNSCSDSLKISEIQNSVRSFYNVYFF